MPELPEVETVVSDLRGAIPGRRILRVWCNTPRIISGTSPASLSRALRGLYINVIDRRGKNILFYLGARGAPTLSHVLLIHLKMTGHLLLGRWKIKKTPRGETVESMPSGPLAEKVNSYIRMVLYLEGGIELGLSDARKFAKVALFLASELRHTAHLRTLGPDVYTELTKREFYARLQKIYRPIKQALLDQTIFAGLGNIYTDEVLYAARIHPLRRASSLIPQEASLLFRAVRRIIKKAIRLRGASMSDFRDPQGERGRYADHRLVYRRTGELCGRCDTLIRRIVIHGRSAHFCPECQRP